VLQIYQDGIYLPPPYDLSLGQKLRIVEPKEDKINSTLPTYDISALLGTSLGEIIGDSMDKTDHQRIQKTLETSQTWAAVSWTNPDWQSKYTVTPTRTFKNYQGQDCREYTIVAIINGMQEEMDGTACRQADGSWKTVSKHHIVKGKETLHSIAKKYGVSLLDLADWNYIGNPYTVYPGQRLTPIFTSV